MITKSLKDSVKNFLEASKNNKLYFYSLGRFENDSFSSIRGFGCKQELCHRIRKNENITQHCIVFNKIQNKAKFKANLNKIEELLGLKVGKICFITLADESVSIILSHKSFWSQNLLLIDLFCLLVRSANTELDIVAIDDIFKAKHSLADRDEFVKIIKSFEAFKLAALQSKKEFYERDLYGAYGVLSFSEEII